MPSYFDEKTKTWFVKCYYTNYTGTKSQKKKRGFKLQREAKEWERNFLENQQTTPNIIFESFVEIYLEDMGPRLRSYTLLQKSKLIRLYLLPYFGKLPLPDITPLHVRRWQNELMAHRNTNGEAYAPTTLKTMHNQLSAIMNYAVRYYGLNNNPCHLAGSMGKCRAEEMSFWTPDEFNFFLKKISDDSLACAGFMTLYYTGLRIGELLALEYSDIDFEGCTISVSKSCQRIGKKDIITPPKTPGSVRTISIPEFLRDKLRDYTGQIYGLGNHDRIFPCTRDFFRYHMRIATKDGDMKRIRLHDLRHSHASLLIELGFSPVAIADRLGHDKVETTLNTYSHLFPYKRDEVAQKLQSLK